MLVVSPGTMIVSGEKNLGKLTMPMCSSQRS
jgi:hypothetical protein